VGGSDTVVGGEERKRRRGDSCENGGNYPVYKSLRTRGPLSSMGESFRI